MLQSSSLQNAETNETVKDSLESIKIQSNRKSYNNRVAKHLICTCVSLVDFSGRAPVQQSLLAIQVEEASAVSSVAQNATAANTTAQQSSTTEDGGHGHGQTQKDEEKNRVSVEEGTGEEEECLDGAHSGLGRQLGRGGDDQGNGLKNGGTRGHDCGATRSSIPVATVLSYVSRDASISRRR